MDNNTVSIIIASLALFGTIFSPFFVSLLNQSHENKKFEKEFYCKRKCEVIENYLKCVGSVLFCNDYKNRTDIAEWISEIYMYVPKDLWGDIDRMNQLVLNAKHNDSVVSQMKDSYIDLCKKLHGFNRQSVIKNTSKQSKKTSK